MSKDKVDPAVERMTDATGIKIIKNNEPPNGSFGERMNDASKIRFKRDGKWFSLETGKEIVD